MKNVLIIGGNGNIGHAVAVAFLTHGHNVTCFNRGLSGASPPGANVIAGDRHDIEFFEHSLQKLPIDISVDLTAYTRDDVASSARACKASKKHFHISTVATYGRRFQWYPTTEDHPLTPENNYGRDKLVADEYLLSLYEKESFPVTIIKPAICIGPRFGLPRQIGADLTWLSRIISGRPIVVSGDGVAIHQFMHVDDFALALYSLVHVDDCIGQSINVVNPTPTSWNEYHRTAMAILGREVEMVGVPAFAILKASRIAGQPISDVFSHNSFFSSDKFREYSNFRPHLSLNDGMTQVIDSLMQRNAISPLPFDSWEDQLIDEQRRVGTLRSTTGVLDKPPDAPYLSPSEIESPEQALLKVLLSKPSDAPQESTIPKLVREGTQSRQYNFVRYADHYLAVHWDEGRFDIQRITSGNSRKPILVAETLEELDSALDKILVAGREILTERLLPPTFSKVCTNLYLLQYTLAGLFANKLLAVPAVRNRHIPTFDLFQSTSNDPIVVISPAPSRSCNYRCEYCYHHDYGFKKNTSATEKWSRAILTSAEKIRRPIRYSAGAMGEPLFIPLWRDTAIKLLSHDHVLSFAFVSNLSQDIEDFFKNVDATRVGVMASLHPTEFKDHDHDFKDFLHKLKTLRDMGVDLVVNYVLTPDQVHNFPIYRQQIADLQVPMTSNVLRGPFRGKTYPEDFTLEEMQIVETCYDENSYIFDSQSHIHNPYGLECISGHRGFYLEFDGGFFNCHFARQRMGSIYDEKLMVRATNGFCTAQKCESQTTIGWQADVAKDYKVQRTLHHYVKTQRDGSRK